MVELILVFFLVLLWITTLPVWPYSRSWGREFSRGVALVLLITLVLAIFRWLR